MEVLKAVFKVGQGLGMEEGLVVLSGFTFHLPRLFMPVPHSVSGQSYFACKTWRVSVPWPRTHDCCLCVTLLGLFRSLLLPFPLLQEALLTPLSARCPPMM